MELCGVSSGGHCAIYYTHLILIFFCHFANVKGGRCLKGMDGEDIREGLASTRDGAGEGNGRLSRESRK